MVRRKFTRWAFLVADSIVLLFSFYVAGIVMIPPEALPLWSGMGTQPQLTVMAGGLLLVWLGLFKYFGLYRQRYMSFMQLRNYHLFDLVKATSLGTLLLIGVAFLAGLKAIGTEFMLMFWATDTAGTLLFREMLTLFMREMRLQGRNLRHLLIVGTNGRAQELAERIKSQPELGYALRGFIDDNWKSGTKNNSQNGQIVAGLHQISEYLRDHVVDEVVITLPIATLYEEASRVVKLCEEQGIVVHFVPGFDFLNLGSSKITFDSLHDEPIITLIPPPMSGWQLGIKRLMDAAGAALLVVTLSPVFMAVAILVKLTSPGPVLFIQERVGLNKRKFHLLKFRTMSINAEEIQKTLEHLNEAGGPVFKIRNDPRITPMGKFLRRTSLDELPQLINVLWGDMSLVGPRPLPLRDYEGFDQDWHRRRFSVRPGITCLWQVSGRSSITFEEWMELDMEYINRWSLWLDIKILMATIPAVLFQRGAT